MPVRMDRPPPVAVGVDMPREESRFTAQGGVKWVILRRRFMAVPMSVNESVLMVTMVVLGELGLVTVRMTAVIDDDRYGKLVGLRNLLNRFPIGSTIRKPEVFALVTFPLGLNRDGVVRYAVEPAARRESHLAER